MVVLVPPHLLENSPSAQDDIPSSDEESLRNYGADLILRSGKLLKLPLMTVASAAAIYQRFYFAKSFADFDARSVAAASVALATKLDENVRRLPDVILVFYRLEMLESLDGEEDDVKGSSIPPLEIGGPAFESRKEKVVRAERNILRELGFEVNMFLDLPHHYVLRYASALFGDPSAKGSKSRSIVQTSWNSANDSLRTTLCCSHQPDVIAAAAVFLAARSLNIPVPKRPPWHASLEVDQTETKRVAGILHSLAGKPKPCYITVPPKKKVPKSQPMASPLTDSIAPCSPPADASEDKSDSESPTGDRARA
eukprot:CAMPEP_0206423194 /NCGR_PEP_ID=MMETSP0324_2-20121206/2545_1 /ASSEMBLY_ACC=CAM_ASM_000836 /TAXON_ID=2866 /ORGANISM="Crypthecodinium cohnii, Strain Seligo" /LENGTH=309 /DNA_ID=CAMNT_0053887727 /DNA_START=21 /DNA_END=947 /DNA_ORIENTATION=-